MEKLPLQGKLILFADDTTLVYTAKSIPELKLKMQSDVDVLFHWFIKNKLTLNAKKKQK